MPSISEDRRISLQVAESIPRDVGRGFIRMDPQEFDALGVEPGDPVSVEGQRATVCRAMPAYPEDRGQSLAKIDSVTRHNARIGVGDTITVRPCATSPATSVTLTPSACQVAQSNLAFIGSRLEGVAVINDDRVRVNLFGAKSAEFVVTSIAPRGPVTIHAQTTFRINNTPRESANTPANPPANKASYEDIGGLRPQVGRIREMIELPLRHPEVFHKLGIDPPKGVLLHGPPGSGKTLIARTIAHEVEAEFFTISGPEIIQNHRGESEKALRDVWQQAVNASPAIVFIDEIDSIAPKRENTQGEVEKRVVAQLLSLMDGLDRRASVVVIAATNLPDHIDPALRRPGRFDREITIPIPDRQGRRLILDVHTRGMPLGDSVDLDHVADVTHGCVGADLEAVCREAAMACLRREITVHDMGDPVPVEVIDRLEISASDFDRAVSEVEPSAIREASVETPNVRWSDVGGHDEIKATLSESIEWPARHADLIAQARATSAKGVLLAGPPGVGKTLIAKAVASESQANFIAVNGPELMNKFVGESEHAVHDVFKTARTAAPCVLFFDEIDALVPARDGARTSDASDRVLSQFLTEMDGVDELNGVLVLAATNRLDRVDPAVRRHGRFDHVIELREPDADTRAAIFRVHLRDRPIAPDVDPADLASRADHATGAQIASACNTAAWAAVRRTVNDPDAPLLITRDDLDSAIRRTLHAA